MNQPRCIRIFYSLSDAEFAQSVLLEEQINSYIKEDKFGNLKLSDLGMVPRFRLYIDMSVISAAALCLLNRLSGIKYIEGFNE